MFCWKYHLHLSSQIIPKKNKFCSAKIISIPWHKIYFEAKHFSNKLSSSLRISKTMIQFGGIKKNGRYTKMLQDCLALHRRDGVGQVQNLPRLLCGWTPRMVLVLFVLKGSWQLGALPGCGSGACRTHQLRFSSGADSNRFPPFSLFLPHYYFTRNPESQPPFSAAHLHLEGLGLRESAEEASGRPSAPPPPGGNRAPLRLVRWPGTYLQVIQVYSGDLRVQEVFIGVELSDDVVHGRQPLVLIHRGYTVRP